MSSIGTTGDEESEKWLDIEDNISVPTQTLEEILAESSDFLDEDLSALEDDDFSIIGRSSSQSVSHVEYHLSSPILIKKQEAISHQVISVKDRPDGGTPSAVSISPNFIAVGTTRGLTLIFERATSKLSQFVHPGKDYGAVSCLDFSPDVSKLAIGFSRGALIVFNCQSKKIINDTDEIVQVGRGILHVRYVDNNSMLLVDSGGSVFQVNKLSNRKKRNSRCIFTGCKGEVVSICAIVADELILLASLKQVLVLSTKIGAVIAQLRLNGPAEAPPLMDWRKRVIQVTAKRTVDETKICLARGHEIRIYQTQPAMKTGFMYPLLKVIKTPDKETIINIKWIDDHHLLVLNSRETLHLIEIQKGAIISTYNMSNTVDFVYNSSDFKGLATGGNVSAALELLSDNVCYHSFVRHNDVIYSLGQSGIYAISLLDQAHQLDLFVERGETACALLYAIDVYTGRVKDKSMRGDLRSRISGRIPTFILKLLDITTNGLPEGNVNELSNHYKRNILVLQRACIATSHFDLLYNTIYPHLEKDPLSKTIFLELLDEFIVEGQLDAPPPSLVHDYLTHLSSEGQLSQFELSVTKLPIESLDIHQVMTTCKQHQLFDGIIYIMNTALFDYLTPLEEMFSNLQRFYNKEVLSDWEIVQGNKLLLYLNCCLAGRAYLGGYLPENLCELVPIETYKFLIQLRPKSPVGDSSTLSGDCMSFPNLRLLLKYDSRQFLNMISSCADAPLFANSDGRLKRLVDILIGISETYESNDLSSILLPFITTLLQKSAIPVDIHLFTQLLEHVLAHSFTNQRTQISTEYSVIDLMRTVPELDQDRILKLAQPLPHSRICTYIFASRGQFKELFQCCLRDTAEPDYIFTVLDDLLGRLRDRKIEDVKVLIANNITILSDTNTRRTGKLILDHLPDYFSKKLKLPFELLRECFEIRRAQGYHSVSNDEDLDENLFGAFFEGTIKTYSKKSDQDSTALDEKLADILNYWLPFGSRTDFCLNLAMDNDLLECSTLLLVSRQLISRAFELLYEGLVSEKDTEKKANRISMIVKLAESSQPCSDTEEWLTKVFRFLLSSNNNHSPYPVNFNTDLWKIFMAMIEKGCLGIGEIVDELFSHPSFRDAKYSDFSRIISVMLRSSQTDRILYKHTLACMQAESVQEFRPMMRCVQKLFSSEVKSNSCVICFQQISKSFLLFKCGHVAHLECSPDRRELRTCVCSSPGFPLPSLESKLSPMCGSMLSKNNHRHINIFQRIASNSELGPPRRLDHED
ncbi:golgi CORVET complex core vacuolar protein 8 domain-containing protein [Ditylenchus destructor]|nr:golgi CORVET complex core vacuolar protein 8 domain-containing protein [Ditylenchus destructor]